MCSMFDFFTFLHTIRSVIIECLKKRIIIKKYKTKISYYVPLFYISSTTNLISTANVLESWNCWKVIENAHSDQLSIFYSKKRPKNIAILNSLILDSKLQKRTSKSTTNFQRSSDCCAIDVFLFKQMPLRKQICFILLMLFLTELLLEILWIFIALITLWLFWIEK